jgi:hypothetical protein
MPSNGLGDRKFHRGDCVDPRTEEDPAGRAHAGSDGLSCRTVGHQLRDRRPLHRSGRPRRATKPTPGEYNQAFNDSHGTHVSGTVGASREGVGQDRPTGRIANMHGVAFNADLYNGNTHKTDGVLYGFPPATRRDDFKIQSGGLKNGNKA